MSERWDIPDFLPSRDAVEPHVIDLIRELRFALGLPYGALPITPQQAWREALDEVHRLRTGKARP